MNDSPSPTAPTSPDIDRATAAHALTLRDAMDAYRVAAFTLADLHAKAAPAPVIDEARTDLADAANARVASIVAFLGAEADRFDRSARSASGDFVYDRRALEISCDKLRAQADIIRSLAAQIARGDDLRGDK